MTIDHVDLNLLRVLAALLETGSVAAAAERLHLSPPAVSRSLGCLRIALDDPLFVRAGRRLQPTPRAEELRRPARDALDAVAAVLSPPPPVEPANVERRSTIRADDAIIAVMGLPLITTIRNEAPGIDVAFLPPNDQMIPSLRLGETDLIIGVGNPDGPELRSERLLTDHFVAAMQQNHPLADGPLLLRDYAEAGHITVSPRGDGRGPVDDALDHHGLHRRHVATVTSFVVAAHIVCTTNLVGTLPNLFVGSLAKTLPITSTAIPLDLPDFHLEQTWHSRSDNDPIHRWLRHHVAGTAKSEGNVKP